MTKHSLVLTFEDPTNSRTRFCRVLEFNYPGILSNELRGELVADILGSQDYFDLEMELDADGFSRTYAFWSIETESNKEEDHVSQEEDSRQ